MSSNQSEEWQNFVAVKEMVHLLDSETLSTKDKSDIENLLEDLASDVDLSTVDTSAQRGKSLIADHTAIVTAMEILLPYEVRSLHRAKYADDKIAAYELAQVAVIPDRYVRFAMGERYFERVAGYRSDRQIQDIPPPP